MNFEFKTLGPFEALVSKPPSSLKTFVIFHGYGANAKDLAGLAPYLDPQNRHSWIFPEGPLSLDLSPFMVSRAWFELNMLDFEKAIQDGSFESYIRARQQGLKGIREPADAFLKALETPFENIVLGGFSQGSMMALDLALRQSITVAGLILFSSSLVDPSGWAEGCASHPKLKFFQSHGREDPVLPFDLGKKLFEMLVQNGLEGEFVPFEGGHEIPPVVINKAKAFIDFLT